MRESKLQIDSLKHLYATESCARALLDHAARQIGLPHGSVVTVESLRNTLEAEQRMSVSRRELTRTLRAFAEASCGRLVAGRRGQATRFVWALPPATLGAAVRGAPPPTAPPPAAPPPPTTSPATAASPALPASPAPAASQPPTPAPATPASGAPNPDTGMYSHSFRLRPKMALSLSFPVDFTAEEAERVARFVQTLPLKRT